MSQYATKRAQEAAENYEAAEIVFAAAQMECEDYDELKELEELVEITLAEFKAALRTDQLVASGDAVDVNSLMDGAL